jgi:transcriptional regulator with XRE-family HTH domain
LYFGRWARYKLGWMDQGSLDRPPGIGPALHDALTERGLNGAQLAEKVGVSENSVSSWMTGKYSPSRRNAERIAAVLGGSIDEVYGRAPARATETAPTWAGTGATDAERLVRQLAELRATETALRGLSEAVPPLLDVLSRAQALADRWSSLPASEPDRN